jgi:hypothetical protein
MAIDFLFEFKLVRFLIGGNWYLIADYHRDRRLWVRNSPRGYEILEREYWG